MKTRAFDRTAATAPATDPVKRRRVLAGAGLAGAAAVAAKVLPGTTPADPEAARAAAAPPDTSAGYRLSEHVRRYYETTKA